MKLFLAIAFPSLFAILVIGSNDKVTQNSSYLVWSYWVGKVYKAMEVENRFTSIYKLHEDENLSLPALEQLASLKLDGDSLKKVLNSVNSGLFKNYTNNQCLFEYLIEELCPNEFFNFAPFIDAEPKKQRELWKLLSLNEVLSIIPNMDSKSIPLKTAIKANLNALRNMVMRNYSKDVIRILTSIHGFDLLPNHLGTTLVTTYEELQSIIKDYTEKQLYTTALSKHPFFRDVTLAKILKKTKRKQGLMEEISNKMKNFIRAPYWYFLWKLIDSEQLIPLLAKNELMVEELTDNVGTWLSMCDQAFLWLNKENSSNTKLFLSQAFNQKMDLEKLDISNCVSLSEAEKLFVREYGNQNPEFKDCINLEELETLLEHSSQKINSTFRRNVKKLIPLALKHPEIFQKGGRNFLFRPPSNLGNCLMKALEELNIIDQDLKLILLIFSKPLYLNSLLFENELWEGLSPKNLEFLKPFLVTLSNRKEFFNFVNDMMVEFGHYVDAFSIPDKGLTSVESLLQWIKNGTSRVKLMASITLTETTKAFIKSTPLLISAILHLKFNKIDDHAVGEAFLFILKVAKKFHPKLEELDKVMQNYETRPENVVEVWNANCGEFVLDLQNKNNLVELLSCMLQIKRF